MSYYPEDQSIDNLRKLKRNNVCAECERALALYLDLKTDLTYLACPTPGHEGIARVYQTNPRLEYEKSIRRLHEMAEKSMALSTIPKTGQLTEGQAMHILKLVYPDVPEDEIIRCAILCRDFGLHPLLKEVYIIPFGQGDKRTWATVLGINATRKLMAQRGTYSYIDNTPRIMTEEEQIGIFGEVDQKDIVAITKLRTKDGMEAPGYGRYPKGATPYGMDKGNTRANMAFIRSERNAFGRLSPDAIPHDVEIVDEAYVQVPDFGKVDQKTGEIIEGVAREITEEEPPVEDKPPETFQDMLTTNPEIDETPITAEQIGYLSAQMKQASMTEANLGEFCNKQKGWNIKFKKDLKKWQYDEIMVAFEKGK